MEYAYRFLTTSLLIFSLSACGGSDDSTTSNDATDAGTKAATEGISAYQVPDNTQPLQK